MVQVRVKYLRGMHFQGEGSARVVTNMDAAVTAGGGGMGTSPMELVLMAIAGCSGMDVVSILGKMRVGFERFEIEVQGERASEHPRIFTDVEVVYKFWGKELPEEKLRRAITLSMDKYCSVANMIDKAANLTYRLDINPS